MYQIFSTNSCIYKISSSFERLYRIQYHREQSSNEVDESRVYKRVEREKLASSSLRGTKPYKVSGHSERYNTNRYELYQMVKADVYGKNRIYGFMIEKKRELLDSSDEPRPRFYYEFERKER